MYKCDDCQTVDPERHAIWCPNRTPSATVVSDEDLAEMRGLSSPIKIPDSKDDLFEKHHTKRRSVDAVQFTDSGHGEDNADAIADRVDGRVTRSYNARTGDRSVILEFRPLPSVINSAKQTVLPGDWILIHDQETFEVVSERDFTRYYE